MTKLISTNPADGYKKVGEVTVSTVQETKRKVNEANQAKKPWKELGVEKRTEMLRPIYNEVVKRKKEIAELVMLEIGKPITEAIDDINWDLTYFSYFLDNGKKFLADEITHKENNTLHKVVYEPIGTAAVIVPWNFPFGNMLWGVIPNLIVGNTVVAKHSEECPLSGKLFDEIMKVAKLPRGVFSQVYGDGKVGEILVNQDIDLIWFTGSSKIGKILYETAGKKFIKAILEMGGSNPAIVFDDVEIDSIIDKLYYKRYLNCGQVCDAVKRLIVHQSKHDILISKLEQFLETKKIGNPKDPSTHMGSLVAKRQLDVLEDQVEDALKKGAKLVCGGKPKNLPNGAYYLPTILTGVKRNMRVWQEEVFGPVLAVTTFTTEDEAVQLANDTEYGLGAEIYSKDLNRASRVARQIDAGSININNGNHWLPCNPFGGYKSSGMGREHGRWGFQELCQIKNIAIG